jgi:hypothetical protein
VTRLRSAAGGPSALLAAKGQSTSPRSGTGGSCSAPATCTSGPGQPHHARAPAWAWLERAAGAARPRLARAGLAATGRIDGSVDTSHFEKLPGELLPRRIRAESQPGCLPARSWPGSRGPGWGRRRHFFRPQSAIGPFSHVRFNIYPDGGVSRLRLHGRPSAP